MKRFIRLLDNSNKSIIFINFNKILYFEALHDKISDNFYATKVCFDNGKDIFVHETPKDIISKINEVED